MHIKDENKLPNNKLKVENATTKDMLKELGVDNERFEEIEVQTIHKLNQEKIKQELVKS